ncbi:serine/Arginine-related protein 53 [Empidonax traillii]|uniref:serine/Arginine-related protein 53 n=1 Tax=Empidonax traillii TaxID=164674 RepID=UPI000FFD5F8F|nr:serine/Arginine-related protein 53 [Empidonax traillii]
MTSQNGAFIYGGRQRSVGSAPRRGLRDPHPGIGTPSGDHPRCPPALHPRRARQCATAVITALCPLQAALGVLCTPRGQRDPSRFSPSRVPRPSRVGVHRAAIDVSALAAAGWARSAVDWRCLPGGPEGAGLEAGAPRRSRSRGPQRSYSRSSERSGHRRTRSGSRDRERRKGRDKDKDKAKDKGKGKDKDPSGPKAGDSGNIKAGLEHLTPAEQAKARLQLVLEAAAKADEALKAKERSEEEAKRRKEEDQATLVDQVRRVKEIEAIESDAFVPQTFRSSKEVKKVAEPPELQHEPVTVTAGTAEAAAPEKEPPPASIPTAIKYQDDNSLAHPNLFIEKAEAEERWFQRLVALRQERLMGSPVA